MWFSGLLRPQEMTDFVALPAALKGYRLRDPLLCPCSERSPVSNERNDLQEKVAVGFVFDPHLFVFNCVLILSVFDERLEQL